jgi:hypothetical protein
MRTPIRSLVVVGALATLTGSLGGCGAPEHRYIRSPQDVTAFKLPSSWAVYEGNELTAAAFHQPVGGTIEWVVGFDGSPEPSPGNVIGSASSPVSPYPNGIARVDVIPVPENRAINIATLRNLVVPIDAIIRDEELPDDAVVIDTFDSSLFRDGLRGVRVEYEVLASALARARGLQLPDDEPDEYVRVVQLAYIEEASGLTFVLAVMCSASCFERYGGEIDTVIDSWTVLP